MAHADFVHLRVHSAYSLSEGAIPIKKLMQNCQGFKMPAVAVTDTANLFGALDFSSAAKGAGVQPILGCQLYLSVEQKKEDTAFKRDLRTPDPDQIVLLAQNEAGYMNLLKLVSHAYMETPSGELPQFNLEYLSKHADGLICLTGGVKGTLGRLLLENKAKEAEKFLLKLKDLFGDRLYIELMRHGLAEEQQTEDDFLDLAYEHNIPLVATNDVFFPDRKMYEAHDALICIAEGSYVDQQDRRRLTPEHYLKSPEEMRKLFADLPEAVDNTLQIAKRCAYMVEWIDPILPPFDTGEGMTEEEKLREMTLDGLNKRLEVHVYTEGMSGRDRDAAAKPYLERMDFELNVINQMGFPGYFLIVSDFIQWSKAHDIPVGPGRGSGAGSVVAWALTITDLDPLRFSLLFERFLNPERVSMPDFDIDFCQDRRGEVIRYVQDKYGHDKVAQIITFGKLQARAVVRDVGRVLQMPYGQVDRISKMVPNDPGNAMTLTEAIEAEPELRAMQREEPVVERLLDIGQKLEGLYRHASTHAAGVVIGDRPLDELVPLYRDPRSDMPVTQFNMKFVESAGLVKFDFLGLKTLTVLSRAVDYVKKTKGIDIDLSAIPLDDKTSFDLLGKAETAGVFQLESSGMREVLKKLKPETLEEIVAVVALYRPGPMDNIPSYINRKHGREEPDYLHPKLEPILKETFGIIIYQEQVMQIAQVLSGYSLGGADLLRRAMGKKIAAEMEKQRALFVEGAVAREVDKNQASSIFDLVAKFASYGFNKSHAAAYALVAYQTAYMKANHPVEFMAAIMSLDLNNTDKLAFFRQEVRRMGLDLLTPDINKSEVAFAVEDGNVRYALAAIKNVGEAVVESIVEERRQNGPYKDMADFTDRLDMSHMNRRQLENLIKVGCFDSLEPNRAKLFAGIPAILGHASSIAQDRATGQSSLFGGGDIMPTIELPDVPDWPNMDRLKREAEGIGFFLSAHPIDDYADLMLQRLRVVKSTDLERTLSKGGSARVKLACILDSKRERVGKTGKRYAFAEMSDPYGSFEATFFSEILSSAREILEPGIPLLLTVSVEKRGEEGEIRMTAQQVEKLDDAVSSVAKRVIISFRDPKIIPDLQDIIRADGAGRAEILLAVQAGEQEIEVLLKGRYKLSGTAIGAFKALPGILNVQEL